ncbi:anti-sigma regulatory factor [Catellatospora tritici]|uniref:anti-sigma regulatory factor n=1 Tax=Catellatospora tritici TaxID=2851566 RepID=UPI001C2CDFA7|nr:anti-sigma regulatory factor [Catellatospora tritici]MBV1848954.1 anti-sigma regulatory factor [Catellatospora tritici]
MLHSTAVPLTDNVVAVTVPADGGWLGILRTATAGLAARLRFAGDKIEDLRIAVDEACAMLLVIAPPGADLHCRFEIGETELGVVVSAPADARRKLPEASAFAWKVLNGLTSRVEAEQTADRATIRLVTELPHP